MLSGPIPASETFNEWEKHLRLKPWIDTGLEWARRYHMPTSSQCVGILFIYFHSEFDFDFVVINPSL